MAQSAHSLAIMFDQLKEKLAKDGTMTFTVRVHLHARQTRVVSKLEDGSYKVDVRAPADSGKANAELLRFLASEFSVQLSQVELVTGGTSRRKVVRITR